LLIRKPLSVLAAVLCLDATVVWSATPFDPTGKGGALSGRSTVRVTKLGRDTGAAAATLWIGASVLGVADADGCRLSGPFETRGGSGRTLVSLADAATDAALASRIAQRVEVISARRHDGTDTPIHVSVLSHSVVIKINRKGSRVSIKEKARFEATAPAMDGSWRGKYRAKLAGSLDDVAPVCAPGTSSSTVTTSTSTTMAGATSTTVAGATSTTTTLVPLGECIGALFVDGAAGADGNPGTRDAPFATIQAAIAAAAAAGGGPVCVVSGTYAESLDLASGVHLFGGVDPSAPVRDPMALPTRVEGGVHAISGTGVTDVTIDGFEISSADATAPGASSIAVRLIDSTGILLKGNTIAAGDGAPGTHGADGKDPPAGQAAGGANGNVAGIPNLIQPDLCKAGAGAGSGAGAGGAGGNGGGACAGGHSGSSGRTHANQSADNAGAGECENQNRCNPFQTICTTPSSRGGSGGVGPAGTTGSHGAGGAGFGSVSGGAYAPADGAAAGAGRRGAGGGGGGGGGGSIFIFVPACGGGAGGGGQGGIGGDRGIPGGGGGASVGILITGGSQAEIRGSAIGTGAGGDGGRGGLGKNGQDGGDGGFGGNGFIDGNDFAAGSGGPGGPGGRGGRGGDAGSGGGGPSIGVVEDATSSSARSDNTFELGAAGAGGMRPGADPVTRGADGEQAESRKLP
jgi:hypothetical protein